MKGTTRTITLAGAALAGFYLLKKNRGKVTDEIKEAVENPEQFMEEVIEQVDTVKRILTAVYMEIWGAPQDEEDGRMVSEGALTSVQYYNKNQEPDRIA
ncbi:hypothetical protein [Planococcus lenghuensis]|uniref:Uncharacterized protein n=1 Tax=Planococcus lenghuensis TaxID=2213202 RepID=A0A1Q2KUW9_9BACL|nr:hypothetical protein [Planococcus lenghuensis]AQQ51991.1 hypothetical protein B0X71_01860 [Planococcus lenghuensis]